jgi:hypothetical protein
MPQMEIPKQLLDDLSSFISKKYTGNLPNSLLIAQEFMLTHEDYGRELGLPVINKAIEDGIDQGLF